MIHLPTRTIYLTEKDNATFTAFMASKGSKGIGQYIIEALREKTERDLVSAPKPETSELRRVLGMEED